MTTAADSAERVLAGGAAGFRAGSVLLLVAAAAVPATDRHRGALLALVVVAALQSLAFAGLFWRTGRARPAWVLADLLVVVGLYATTASPLCATDRSGLSPLYSFVLITAITAGMPAWPLGAAVGTASLFSIVTVAQAGPVYPLWNAVPDGLAFVGSALIAWVICQLVRRAQVEYDRNWAAAAQQAAVLARERERAAQARSLRIRLLSTVEDVVAADTVADPVIARQLRREVDWLRRVVDSGLQQAAELTDTVGGLATGLRELAAERSTGGLTVHLELPDTEPSLPVEGTAAILGAVREALTNVARHAGTGTAWVRLEAAEGVVLVHVVDRGRGFDKGATPEGAGLAGSVRARLAEVGGDAVVASTPGAGTHLTLRVPL